MMQNFALRKPMIQAPMAGVTSPKFVAACCEAGILGSIGAGYLNGAETKEFIQQVKALTDKRFCVNLFVQDEPKIDISVLQDARVALQPFYEELGVSNTQRVVSTEVFNGQVQAIIDEDVKICSFTFGLPNDEIITRLKAHGIYLIGTATTVEEAIAVETAGLDAVVVQGCEAGGHRGSFTDPIELIPTKQLLRDVLKNVSINCIAAGGIMTAEHVKEMQEMGATAVQIGTALLTAHECEVSNVHKSAVLESEQKATTLTKAFTGKYARGLKNEFTEKLKDAVVAPYPVQHYLTLAIRKESAKQNRPEYLSLWMGENSYLAKEASVQEIVDELTSVS
ncbi:2-nitropropane dioxygenase [Solibacillus sp. R5-41]|uniref:NAD(P)H-dependent flavin oxidoreductase n=1 Tax=Solibacillus sp. R5-41 TaxID=2048654 RepID=UPI000C1246A2|nr:nitronate monooxygenase [Solibacillus sp. R5-41]ATP40964.1 2-nitropropane dioxygenase [Solibacillus sp. R5-41]